MYHDFVEVTTESILEFTKQVGGNRAPVWDKNEVNEIVIAQVIKRSMLFHVTLLW